MEIVLHRLGPGVSYRLIPILFTPDARVSTLVLGGPGLVFTRTSGPDAHNIVRLDRATSCASAHTYTSPHAALFAPCICAGGARVTGRKLGPKQRMISREERVHASKES